MCILPLPCNNPGLIIVLPLFATTSGCGSGGSAAGDSAAVGSVSRTAGLSNYSKAEIQVT